jgi:hypothetical protein
MKPTVWPAAWSSLEHRGEARRRGTLAVGAGDQRADKPFLWVAHTIEDGAGALGAKLHPEAPES